MKVLITESQYKSLKEVIDIVPDEKDTEDILNTFEKGHFTWFDYIDPEVKDKIGPNELYYALKYGVRMYSQRYNIRRVVIKDDDKVVGFLIYSTTSAHKEYGDEDTTPRTVLLSTAIHPDYRNRGLLKRMIERASIEKPFFVHTSSLSTPQVWEKMGCKVVKNMGGANNAVEICN